MERSYKPELMDDSKDKAFSEQNRTETQRAHKDNSSTRKTKLKPDKTPALRRGSEDKAPLLTRKLFDTDGYRREESVFFIEVLLGRYISHIPGRACAQQ